MSLSLPAVFQPLPPRYLGWMLEGFRMTLLVSAAAIAGGLAIGLLLTALRASAQPWLHLPAREHRDTSINGWVGVGRSRIRASQGWISKRF